MRDGRATNQNILDAAQALVLEQGFSATSVDDIIDRADISRGTFFYHFPTKGDLARKLIERYASEDHALIERFMARAEKLSRDPLQQVLIFIGLYIEMFEQLEAPFPGCLFASYCYEAGLFDEGTQSVIADAFVHWRHVVGAKLEQAIARQPPRMPVDAEGLADLAYGIFEGAFIVSKTLKEPQVIAEQLRHYRSYLELLFGVAE